MARGNSSEQGSSHVTVAILHGVHVRTHQRRDFRLLGASCATLATLLAKFRLCREALVGEELFLIFGVGEIAGDGEVLLQMLVGADARNRGGHEVMSENPLQQRGLADRRKRLRQVSIRANAATGLRFHGDDANAALGGALDRT